MKTGHIARDCTVPDNCHACGSRDHKVADCPSRDKTCDVCGQTGHLRRKCRQANRRS